ncbi:hypothetical protein QYM36_018750 [Artemia franciscana]|uniref:Malectin domain-containing protein n=1 Tax=Artemia franciscana TaxID=6661 RepID=A0AA88KUB5_ARTSF|nr:hypothetical protein QYM36_018750 [Artemia franciscana]
MDSSIRNQPTADGTSINLEILASEKGLETAAECVSSTNETVRVNVFPAHLRETSLDIWLHSSTKEINDPISNGIVSSGGTMASLADGQISPFVDIELKKANVDDLLTELHKSRELVEERSLASERPSSPSSSKSFEVLAWLANQEQSSNEHQLRRLDSLDIEMDGHSTGRIMNKSNIQESCFHSSGSFPASEISQLNNAVQFDSENTVRCAQGQEFEMVNGCNSTCNENLRKESTSTSCLNQTLLKNILDAMETKLEAFRRTIKAELGGPDHPDSLPKWFLEYLEAEKLKENFESHAEQQATKIRLQNALTELETTRAEMVKVQKESVRNTAMDWTAITSLRNDLNRVQNELALKNSKHAEEISSFKKKNAATTHALEQSQTEASSLKSSLESSLAKNDSAVVQLAKAEGRLEVALDRENSLKLELKEHQLSALVKEKDDSYKHAEEISLLEETNAATILALEQTQTEASQLKSSLENSLLKNESDLMQLAKAESQLEEALGRENILKIELKKLQNELCAVTDEKDKKNEYLFCANSTCFGFRDFMPWSDIFNPENGYIKDDCVIPEHDIVVNKRAQFDKYVVRTCVESLNVYSLDIETQVIWNRKMDTFTSFWQFVIGTLIVCNLTVVSCEFSPKDVVYAVNCGGDYFKDRHGINYQSDKSSSGIASDFGKQFLVFGRVSQSDSVLYQTEKWNHDTFGYDLPLDGDGDYVLVLKFSEVYFNSPGAKVFGVLLNDRHTVISDLDIYEKVGKAVAHEEYVPFSVQNGKMNFNGESSTVYDSFRLDLLKGQSENPKINAFYLYKGDIKGLFGSRNPSWCPGTSPFRLLTIKGK